MTEYTVRVKSTHVILAAFRISNDLMEHQYLKEKYGVNVSRYDIGKFLIVDKETNRYIIQDVDSFNANYEVANRESIYPMIPFKNAEDRPKLNAFGSGSVCDWLRKEFSGVACAPTFKHIDIREQKKEKNTMYGKSKTINLCVNKVIFNGPATIVIWSDDTKTVVKCKDGDNYSKWAGFAMCIAKRVYGEDFHRIFRHWCGVEDDIPKKNTGDGASISEAFKDLGKSACDCAESLSKALEGYYKVPDYRDVVFKDTFETGLVLKNMRNIIHALGFVSVADCCHLVGVPNKIEDHDIGWTDVSKAMIVPVKNGFLIKYPEPASRNQPDHVEKEPNFQLRKVYYENSSKAHMVRSFLLDVIHANGYATVADYYFISHIGVSPEEMNSAREYGWKDIGVANIGLCGPSTFKLDIPEPKRLNLNKPNEAKSLDDLAK